MKRLVKKYLLFLPFILLNNASLFAISSLAKNDPYPIYNAIYDPYLLVWTKDFLKGCGEDKSESWSISISPFIQKAKRGRTFGKIPANLGDLEGFPNMLALLYGGKPADCHPWVDADGNVTQLGKAKQTIFADLFCEFFTNPDGTVNANPDVIISNTSFSTYLLLDDTIGHFSLPIRYKKVGVRFELEALPFCNAGFTIQGGISEIRQTLTEFTDLGAGAGPLCCGTNPGSSGCFPCDPQLQTFPNNFFRNIPFYIQIDSTGTLTCSDCDPTAPSGTACTTPYTQIELQLMEEENARKIFLQLGLDPCNFEETSFEDFRFIFWWRQLYEINKNPISDCYPYFLLVPAISFNVIAPVGKEKDRCKLLGLPFGNDRHWSVGFDAGLSIDFVETLQIGASAGMNYFFERDVKRYRLPTFYTQSGIYPCTATVSLKPGYNFNFNAFLNAYHFLSCLSAHAEWVFVKHEQDKIKLRSDCSNTTPLDPIFTPALIDKAECTTKFASHMINTSLYYDISPNIYLGLMFQFPIGQRNAYKSTSYLATFRAVF